MYREPTTYYYNKKRKKLEEMQRRRKEIGNNGPRGENVTLLPPRIPTNSPAPTPPVVEQSTASSFSRGGAMRSLHGLMDTRFVRGGEDYFYNISHCPSSVAAAAAAGAERARA